MAKHGYEYVLQSPIVKQKSKETCLERYGVDNPTKSPEVQEKRKKTNLERYGFDSPTKAPEIKEKSKETTLERYGVDHHNKQLITCPWCNKTGGRLGMLNSHFDSCSKNPDRIINIIKCPECEKEGIDNNAFRGKHFDNCKNHKNYVKKEYEILICPVCNKTGIGNSAFKGHHFDNCKTRKSNGNTKENS